MSDSDVHDRCKVADLPDYQELDPEVFFVHSKATDRVTEAVELLATLSDGSGRDPDGWVRHEVVKLLAELDRVEGLAPRGATLAEIREEARSVSF